MEHLHHLLCMPLQLCLFCLYSAGILVRLQDPIPSLSDSWVGPRDRTVREMMERTLRLRRRLEAQAVVQPEAGEPAPSPLAEVACPTPESPRTRECNEEGGG